MTPPLFDGRPLPALEDILDADFLRRFELDPPSQYGIACRDVAAARARAEDRGGGPFVGARIPAPNWIEEGQRRSCSLDFALGEWAGVQVEYLGPGKGTGFYADRLQGEEEVLHHVGVYQRSIDAIEESLNRAGYRTVVSGGVRLGWLGAFEFKYFDTREDLGLYLEILDFHAPGQRPLDLRPLVQASARLRAALRRR